MNEILIAYAVFAVVVIITLLMQAKDPGGLGLTSSSDSYWGKNRKNTFEGKLDNFTRAIVALFIVATIVVGYLYTNNAPTVNPYIYEEEDANNELSIDEAEENADVEITTEEENEEEAPEAKETVEEDKTEE